jgi:hypothetical protein
MQKTARKTIAFDIGMIQEAEYFASAYHMDFSDFTRYTISQKLEELRKREQEKTFYMSGATEKAVIEGEKEYEEGKTKGFTDIKKLMKYLTRKR